MFPVSLFAAGDHFTFLSLVGIPEKYSHIIMAAIATGIIFLICKYVEKSYETSGDPLVPEPRFNLRNIVELATQQLYGMIEGIIGKKTPKYFPLMAAIFFYVFINNLMGLFAGFSPATGNVNTNFSISIIVFLYYNYEGWREHGAGYLKHFMGPVLWLAPLMTIVELVGHAVRPVSLGLRLFGNINGDHMVLGIFSDFVPMFLPVIFLGLGLFVSFLQAFIFTLLSSIYINLAISHDH